jgi:hypothetical protein
LGEAPEHPVRDGLLLAGQSVEHRLGVLRDGAVDAPRRLVAVERQVRVR